MSQYDIGPGGTLSPKRPAAVPAGPFPASVAVSPNGRSVYVERQQRREHLPVRRRPSSALSPKTPPTATTLAAPVGLAVTPDGRSLYVANAVADVLSQ